MVFSDNIWYLDWMIGIIISYKYVMICLCRGEQFLVKIMICGIIVCYILD